MNDYRNELLGGWSTLLEWQSPWAGGRLPGGAPAGPVSPPSPSYLLGQVLNQTSRMEIQLLETSLSTNKLEKQLLLQGHELHRLQGRNRWALAPWHRAGAGGEGQPGTQVGWDPGGTPEPGLGWGWGWHQGWKQDLG